MEEHTIIQHFWKARGSRGKRQPGLRKANNQQAERDFADNAWLEAHNSAIFLWKRNLFLFLLYIIFIRGFKLT